MPEQNKTLATSSYSIASEMQPVIKYMKRIISNAAVEYNMQEEDIHVGHLILHVLGEHPDFIAQIDAMTGASETFESVRRNVIRLSTSVTRAGYNTGDVILLLLPNDRRTCYPIYMGFVNGLTVLPVDPNSTYKEIDRFIRKTRPKIIFCMKNNEELLKKVLNARNINVKVIVVDDSGNDIETFIESVGVSDEDVDAFKVPRFKTSTPAWLLSTSGTTGQPKLVTLAHRMIITRQPYYFYYFKTFPKPTKSIFVNATPQWVTCMHLYCRSVLFVFTRIQLVSNQISHNLFEKIENKYKPTYMTNTPLQLMELFNSGMNIDSFDYIQIGGAAISGKLQEYIRVHHPKIRLVYFYGLTEVGQCFASDPSGPLTSVGVEFPIGFQYRLVDPATGSLVTKPNVPGELWIKSSCPFEGYYNDPMETSKIYSDDGYIKSGDLLYRDSNGYYFYVERLKMLMKFHMSHVYPIDIEEVLRGHPAVKDAAVTSVKDPVSGDLPVALVIVKEGSAVSAKELRESVSKALSDAQKLRGGVVFVDELPRTVSYKVNRSKLREIATRGKVEF